MTNEVAYSKLPQLIGQDKFNRLLKKANRGYDRYRRELIDIGCTPEPRDSYVRERVLEEGFKDLLNGQPSTLDELVSTFTS